MADKKAQAVWNGDLKKGKGKVTLESGLFEGPYTFASRFESGEGTNPEELIAAAHAGCYSMALSNELSKAGHQPESVYTEAVVSLDTVDGAPTITTIKLIAKASVPGLQKDEFQKIAAATKDACPVSRVLTGAEIHLDATLS